MKNISIDWFTPKKECDKIIVKDEKNYQVKIIL